MNNSAECPEVWTEGTGAEQHIKWVHLLSKLFNQQSKVCQWEATNCRLEEPDWPLRRFRVAQLFKKKKPKKTLLLFQFANHTHWALKPNHRGGGEPRGLGVCHPYCYIKRRWRMPCEQLVPIDRGLVMVSLLSGNPRENVAFGPARGTRGQWQTMRPLRGVWLLWNSWDTISSGLTLHQLVIHST